METEITNQHLAERLCNMVSLLEIPGDLDLVVASVHSAYSQDRDIMTRRLISAIIVKNHTFSKKSGFVINHRFNTVSTLVKVVSLFHYSYEHVFKNNQRKSLPVISIGLHFKTEWSS